VGKEGAAEEHYDFRIASTTPRAKENKATPDELEILKSFAKREVTEVIRKAPDGLSLAVYRPVYLSEKQGCLSCHGDPAISPWGNGEDVLGYRMENMKDGDLKGAFAIISSLEPVIAETRGATLNIIAWASGFAALALLIGFLIIRRPIRNVIGVVTGVSAASSQVNAAADQLSSSAQSMAEGASQQAASLEEISSTLEQMASMTRQNSDNSKQADLLAEEARANSEKGSESMTRMVGAIGEIKAASDQTARIIKTIDEIAFQTNLLALNAAVEAARAGDAGKGFAVVAEEVRNLAQRSAEAAKNTSELIEDSQRKAENGVSVAGDVEGVLREVNSAIQKVGDLLREVSAASVEQAQGVEQVNTAVVQLDQVTHSSAASAEQNAASSEQLSSQSVGLTAMVQDLGRVIGVSAVDGGMDGQFTALPEGADARENDLLALGERPQPGAGPGRPGNGGSTKLRSRIQDETNIEIGAVPEGMEKFEASDFRDA
jgi:methyl-accepting chemotaxis protein